MLRNEVYSNVYVYTFSQPIEDINKYTANSLAWFITPINRFYIITKEDFRIHFPCMKCDYVIIVDFRPYFIVPIKERFAFCTYLPYDNSRCVAMDNCILNLGYSGGIMENIKQQIKKYKINRLLND